MSDPVKCCILGLCCQPLSNQQYDALAGELHGRGLVANPGEARKVAEWVLSTFDLAPYGSLALFKGEISRMAREKKDK